MSVMVPLVVPLTTTLAPMMGSPFLIDYGTLYSLALLCTGTRRRLASEHNVVALHFVGDSCPRKELLQHRGDSLVGCVDRDGPIGIDIFLVIDKQIVGLLLDVVEHLDGLRVLAIERDLLILRKCAAGVESESETQQ